MTRDSTSARHCGEVLGGEAEPRRGRRPNSMIVPSDAKSAAHAGMIGHKSERGEVKVRLAAPSVMVIRYVGYVDASCVEFVASMFDATFGEYSGVDLFIDCEEQTGYDDAFRERVVEWAGQINAQMRSVCVLVRSRIIAFGVALVDVSIGRTSATVTTREEFCERLNNAVGESLSGGAPGAA